MHGFAEIIVVIVLVWNTDALNCRSDGGPSEQTLKNIYMSCLKHQDGRVNNSRGGTSEEHARGGKKKFSGWRDSTRDDWSREGGRDGMSRDDGRDYSSRYGAGAGSEASRDQWNLHDKYDQRMGGGSVMTGGGRDDFLADEFGRDMPKYPHHQTTPAPRRYRRDRTSGHRSQYNPNSRKDSMEGSRRSDAADENTSAENMTTTESGKACALHCFLRELEMTGENDMPDKHLVSHVITQGVSNEDLRDFLLESIDECFAILLNENPKDKCEFSKNLMLCLSEKGRANCDDWKEDYKF